MARNLKREYLKKLLGIVTPNGYKVDVANYISNPSYDHEYPNMIKMISEDDSFVTYRTVRYFKKYDGSGVYEEEIYDVPRADLGGWSICKNVRTNALEAAPRFSLNKLMTFC